VNQPSKQLANNQPQPGSFIHNKTAVATSQSNQPFLPASLAVPKQKSLAPDRLAGTRKEATVM
jgi:hypothetical protein